MKTRFRNVLLSAFFAFAWVTAADAFVIDIKMAGEPPEPVFAGNPSQPVYEVSGLQQDDAFNLAWTGPENLSATGMIVIDLLTPTSAEIRLMLTNTSPPNPIIPPEEEVNGPRIVSFGLSIEDYVPDSVEGGGIFLFSTADESVPGFNGLNDVCAFSGNNCSGGAGTGIFPGVTEPQLILEVDLDGINLLDGLTLDAFAIKFQSALSGASYELAGVPSFKSVSEPATLLLLGFALAGMGGVTRRKLVA